MDKLDRNLEINYEKLNSNIIKIIKNSLNDFTSNHFKNILVNKLNTTYSILIKINFI